ncbi:hypothetical protein BRLA_c031050 [Brevibacillus laterosporus LMG 15441]|uniref:Uncharacterized protein n=1 Tax=Brevibacillus laterosporus LMG 15441 TaxID=1042163 RepID=A0A075R4E9_BRELA|nr:hypothetical protein BRLA_c031050 [Brevibacillus laterosporus LMG 15441]
MGSGAGITYTEALDMDDETLLAATIVVNEWNEKNPRMF